MCGPAPRPSANRLLTTDGRRGTEGSGLRGSCQPRFRAGRLSSAPASGAGQPEARGQRPGLPPLCRAGSLLGLARAQRAGETASGARVTVKMRAGDRKPQCRQRCLVLRLCNRTSSFDCWAKYCFITAPVLFLIPQNGIFHRLGQVENIQVL